MCTSVVPVQSNKASFLPMVSYVHARTHYNNRYNLCKVHVRQMNCTRCGRRRRRHRLTQTSCIREISCATYILRSRFNIFVVVVNTLRLKAHNNVRTMYSVLWLRGAYINPFYNIHSAQVFFLFCTHRHTVGLFTNAVTPPPGTVSNIPSTPPNLECTRSRRRR